MRRRTDELSQEKGNPNGNRGQVRRLVLLGSQHDDDKNELGSQEHFDKQALCNTGTSTQRRFNAHRTREQGRNDTGRSNATEKLGDHNNKTADGGESTN